jgi:molecular chaperone GrpE
MPENEFEDLENGTETSGDSERMSYPTDLDDLKQALADAKAKAREYLEGWQRGQADFVNYKKRLEQDKTDTIKYANAGLILKILPVLDDFERAIEAVPLSMAKDSWVGGINGIARKLENSLEAVGLNHIKAWGEVFDPSLHEAVGSSSGMEGIVVREMEKGYKLNERVLRPARVVVGNGEGDSASEPSKE